MIELNLDDLNEDDVYKAFEVDGNEGEALNDIYLELYELIGKEIFLDCIQPGLLLHSCSV